MYSSWPSLPCLILFALRMLASVVADAICQTWSLVFSTICCWMCYMVTTLVTLPSPVPRIRQSVSSFDMTESSTVLRKKFCIFLSLCLGEMPYFRAVISPLFINKSFLFSTHQRFLVYSHNCFSCNKLESLSLK